MNGLACCLASLESDVDERAIVEHACCVDHLLTSAISGLGNGYLKLVDVAYDVVGHGSLVNLSMIDLRVPVINFQFLTLGMCSCGVMAKPLKHAVIVGVIGTHYRPVNAGFLAHDKVCAGKSICNTRTCKDCQ